MTTTTMNLTACTVCDEPMRPPNSLSADYPGTKQMATKALCTNCYQRDKYAGTNDPLKSERLRQLSKLGTVDERIRFAAPGFYKYLQERQQAGVPYEGFYLPGEEIDGAQQR